jgi:hypothetical protein
MKIFVTTGDAVEEKEKDPSEKEIHNKEWQEFLTTVVESIEQRRRLLKPSAFRPKDKA